MLLPRVGRRPGLRRPRLPRLRGQAGPSSPWACPWGGGGQRLRTGAVPRPRTPQAPRPGGLPPPARPPPPVPAAQGEAAVAAWLAPVAVAWVCGPGHRRPGQAAPRRHLWPAATGTAGGCLCLRRLATAPATPGRGPGGRAVCRLAGAQWPCRSTTGGPAACSPRPPACGLRQAARARLPCHHGLACPGLRPWRPAGVGASRYTPVVPGPADPVGR